ncbi:hypothetical protein V499_00669 [Pseudogymnoascus sp. VKM F-103]|nr:hypothetical protein V499_00669 [Pseudogymnoascus sp. VKM F-103]
MKRIRSQGDSPGDFKIYEDEAEEPLDRRSNALISPSKDSTPRPSKIRRHGSKILSVLRSLTNSASSASNLESSSPISPQVGNVELARELVKKVSMSFNNMRPSVQPPTIVIRSPKSRPSLSLEKGVLELTPEVSPSTSGEASGNSAGKQSAPARTNSTGMTSLDSKFSAGKMLSGHSSNTENKKAAVTKQQVAEETIVNNSLMPISEVAQEVIIAPVPVPTVITVEKAAAAKIFFETHYNGLLASGPSPRSLRLREFEGVLYENSAHMTHAEMVEHRRDWLRSETNYLREIRVMKSRNHFRKQKGTDPMVSQYEIVKVLGKGSFGVVRLVREKEDVFSPFSFFEPKKKEVYAMKVIRKSDMLRNSQEGHLRAERDFLVASEGSRWVVPLIASFQDANNLYLIMDYMPGGDFLGLLIRDNILSEAVTKWYIAEMILCIEEAHRLRWIHRDIKPDNFLISASGHLKISDFGLAFDGHWSHDQSFYNNHRYSLLTKLGINVEGDSIDKKDSRTVAVAMQLAHVVMGGKDKHEKKSSGSDEGILNWRNRNGNRTLARSVVGTSQYMAPEVVRGELYDARCDWWSVAVILYECLYGHTPFLADEGGRAQTKLNILSHRTTFSFPSKPAVSSRCQDLIKRMIQEKGERLCSRRYKARDLVSSNNRDYAGRYVYPDDAEDIKSHRWFKDILWDRIHIMTPPFVPAIKSIDDTHYFDEEEPISDFSTSVDDAVNLTPPTDDELDAALRCFNREIQILARGYVGSAYDSTKLRRIEREIEGFVMGEEQKEYLRGFVRAYGRKEKKRPRDRLLRDGEYRQRVLECRKRGAFLGYSWRRIQKNSLRDLSEKKGTGGGMGRNGLGAAKGKAKVWMRGRLSVN